LIPSLDLRDFIQPLEQFVLTGIQDFHAENPEVKITQISLYSCPWSGWVSLCFSKKIQQVLNCPDMDYVEFSLFEASAWTNVYEEHEQFHIVRHDGGVFEFDHNTMWDEDFNSSFFNLIGYVLKQQSVVKVIRSCIRNEITVGVQMLDSKLNEVWELSDL